MRRDSLRPVHRCLWASQTRPFERSRPKKRASWTLGVVFRTEKTDASGFFDFLYPCVHASWTLEEGVKLMAGYDIWSGEIRLWWSPTKRERPRCGAKCRDDSSCGAPPVWDKRLDRPVNGRCRMHGGLSTGSKTEEGRQCIAASNRSRSARPDEKRGKRESVTQRGIVR